VKDLIQPARPEAKAVSKSHLPAASAEPHGSALVAGWIVLSCVCSCTGWVLSALHELNAAGYAVAFLLSLAAVWPLRGWLFPTGFRRWNVRKTRWRFRRTFPLAFLVLASLAIFGGVIHAPSNYDAIAYRVPRMLHWLAQGQWHWIYTDFQRVNTRVCGIEWLSVPLIVFTKTDRWLFIINAVSFCLLPGLVFSLFRRAGVRSRVAWHWMWLLPTGYCYLLQAGSIANDMFGTVYSIAAIDYALRARRSGRVSEVCLSVLAVALVTGAKLSNLPFLLPWVVAFVPTWRLWLARPLALTATIAVAAGASFLPMAALNTVHSGEWTGAKIEDDPMGTGSKWLHLLANGVTWPLDNLAPPVFPFASAWNRAADRAIPASLAARFREQSFEPTAADGHLDETQVEDSAGLGFGITTLLGLSVLAVLVSRRPATLPGAAPVDVVVKLICLGAWIGMLYIAMMSGKGGAVRYLAAYYPLLSLSFLLSPGHASVVRQTWWRWWALFGCGLAALLLVICPARPLWPVGWFIHRYGDQLRSNKLAVRALDAYETKGQRAQVFAPLLAALPPGTPVVGFMAMDFPETSLWKPFGTRRILHIRGSDSGEDLRRRGIRYLFVVKALLKEPWDKWLQERNARELTTVSLKMWGRRPPFVWSVVELDAPNQNNNPRER
jgi:hypothetical protein